MEIIYGDNQNFDDLIKEGFVFVDFFASWCGPCKMLSPVLEEIANENPDLKIVKIDVDKVQEIAIRYNVMSIPTLILFKDGKVLTQRLGFVPKEVLLKWILSNK